MLNAKKGATEWGDKPVSCESSPHGAFQLPRPGPRHGAGGKTPEDGDLPASGGWRGCLVEGKKASREDSPVNTDEDVETQSHQMLAGDDARDFSFLLPEFYVVPHPEVTQQVT